MFSSTDWLFTSYIRFFVVLDDVQAQTISEQSPILPALSKLSMTQIVLLGK